MLETPSLVIDAAKMDRNIRRMAGIAREHGVDLRPHVKTHKVPEIAQKQLEHGAAGITVAKVSEAEVMAAGGIRNIFVAYPVVTDSQVRRAVELSKRANLILGVDSLRGAGRLSDAAEAEGRVEIIEVFGFVNSAPGFVEQPYVINGASDLFERVFGERGRHARVAVAANELPFNTPVEVKMVVEVG